MCENIIKFFDENISLQQKGITDSGVNEKIKKTIDITINPDSLKEPKYFLFYKFRYFPSLILVP